MDIYRLYYLSLALQAGGSVALAGWLWAKGPYQTGIKPLALFCFSIGAWGLGQLAIHLGDDGTACFGKFLVNCGPLNAVFFLHFVFRFLDRRRPRQLRWSYVFGVLNLTLAQALEMGHLAPWLGFRRFYFFPAWGVIPGLFVSGISLWAYWLLLAEWPAADPKQRGKIVAICFAGVWGSASTLMFLNPSLGIDIFPYSVILLPGYAVLLVFGILRYDLMAVNLWANRLLAWLLLSGLTVAVVSLLLSVAVRIGFAPLAALPLWQLWLLGSVALGVMLALEAPSRRAMEGLVFPGARLEADVLAGWRATLDAASGWRELEQRAGQALGAHLRQPMVVALGETGPPDPGLPGLHCHRRREADGGAHWRSELTGWQGATPGVVRVGEVFGALLAAAAARLDQLLRYAEQEKERLRQAHLLELGALAATVAHELRNPLNIISMAAVSCEAETRAEIRTQIGRADHLIQDLLSYSGEVRLRRQMVPLAELARRAAAGHPPPPIQVEIDPLLCGWLDPMRAEQILANLIGNAAAMLRGSVAPRILVQAESLPDGALCLRVCDNGPGVPAELAPELFQPFSTRRPGGTGLGLAIVRRLAEAHGGGVRLAAYPGWNCCFELFFPGRA